MSKIEIEFDLTKTRLEFSGMGRPLVINPHPAKCPAFKFVPGNNYTCGTCGKSGTGPEHSGEGSPEISVVPLTRFLDESGDYAASWFAFWEEDCMDPPIWIVRAESFERAYEDFCETLPEVNVEDLDADQIAAEKEGNLSGYSYADGVGLVYTEAVNGREIDIVSATVLS